MVLRVGEHRPRDFFPAGYRGKYFVIPKIYLINTKLNYEIEEYLSGRLLVEFLPRPHYNELIHSVWLDTVIRAFWEWQSIGRRAKLRPVSSLRKMNEFLLPAKKFIKDKKSVERIVKNRKFKFFWREGHPAKWKFSPDNLLALENGKIGFIDLKGASLRHWGYDLGWLIWPNWFHFGEKDFEQSQAHYNYLRKFFARVYALAPVREKRDKDLFHLRWHLVVFERIIGGLYDVAENITHTRKSLGTNKRRDLFIDFLNRLLGPVIERLNKYV